MEPMKAPAAESPANLRMQTTGGMEGLEIKAPELKFGFEFAVGFGLGLGGVSISESESELEGYAGVVISTKP